MANPNISNLRLYVKDHAPLKGIELFIESGFVYLVGANASGKSRFLDAIKNKRCSISRRVSHSGKYDYVNYEYLDWGKAKFDTDYAVKTNFSDENTICREFDHPKVEYKDEVRTIEDGKGEDNRPRKTQEIVGVEHLRETQFSGVDMFSSGMQRRYEMHNWSLQKASQSYKERTGSKAISLIVVSIEEPETNLHSNAARRIPEQLEYWLKQQHSSISNFQFPPILVIATTHSPFIVKGAGSKTLSHKHQVFGFDDCKLQDLTGRQDEERAKNGLSGQQALIQANKMLGAGFGDLMPNPIVMMEPSIQTLLSNVKKSCSRDIFKDSLLDPSTALIINPKGDSDTNLRVNNIKDLVSMLSLLSARKPEGSLIDLELLVVTDDVKHADDLNEEYKKNDQVRVHAYSLGDKQLEDSYAETYRHKFFESKLPGVKVWDTNVLINTYLYTELKIERKKHGVIKHELAEFIGRRITSNRALKEIVPKLEQLIIKVNADNPPQS